MGVDILRGAIVFIAAFLIFFVITLGYPTLPPAEAIYDAVVGAETDYEVVGISATLLIMAVFNGVIYGVIIWLIYTLTTKLLSRRKPETPPTQVSTT
jgi:hypothetical protein